MGEPYNYQLQARQRAVPHIQTLSTMQVSAGREDGWMAR